MMVSGTAIHMLCRLNFPAAAVHNYSKMLTRKFECNYTISSGSLQPSLTSRRNFVTGIIRLNTKVDNLSQVKKSKNWRVRDVMDMDTIYRHLVQDNAQNIVVMELDKVCNYVKYFFVVTANSTRHLEYMAESLNILYKRTKLESDPFTKVEGKRINNNWMSVDIGNSVVHFMLEETREKYELEKLWLLGAQFDDQVQIASETDDGLYGESFLESNLDDVEFLERFSMEDDLDYDLDPNHTTTEEKSPKDDKLKDFNESDYTIY